jgi:hypothetical protein
LGPTKLVWPAFAPGFDTLGWGPEGDVFFSYSTVAQGAGFSADAAADVDGNGVAQFWGYAHLDGAARVALAGGRCDVNGLAAPDQVGPCDATGAAIFGQAEF